MRAFRKILFWLHLVMGLAAGAVIAVVAFTGMMMVFQPQILGWAEREVSRVTPPSVDARPLPLAELIKIGREAQPKVRPQSFSFSADPRDAVTVNLGRSGLFYVDPYTGAVKSGAKPLRDFFQFTLSVHRWLALGAPPQPPAAESKPAGETQPASSTRWREIGGKITGSAALMFFVLCWSGLYLWWPRTWTLRGLKTGVSFNFKLRGKARDWNWHTVTGFWALPVLIVSSFTGTVMAFRSVGDWIYRRPDAEGPSSMRVSRPELGAKPLSADALFAIVTREFPEWETVIQRTEQRQRQREVRPAAPGGAGERKTETRSASMASESAAGSRSGESAGGAEPRVRSEAPITYVVRERNWSPVPAQVSLDPFTGAILQKERFSDYSFRRALRALVLPAHQGTVVGLTGQMVVFFACASALVLVYTGFALAWRRFFKRTVGSTTPLVSEKAWAEQPR